MKLTKTLAAAAGVGLVAAGLLTAVPASADPTDATGTPPSSTRPLQAVGSDTTQNVMNALSEVIEIGGQKQIASWNAIGGLGGDFKTRATNAACTYTRAEANGSTNGRSRLVESLTAGNARSGCLDFSRSSSGKGSFVSPSVASSLTYIPFANDSATVVVRSDAPLLGREYTLDLVKEIYRCNFWPTVVPILPQTGSGTRAFWLSTMGITEAQITSGTYATGPNLPGTSTKVNCLKEEVNSLTGVPSTDPAAKGRAYPQEHNAVTLKTDEIMPFSIGLWNAQASGITEDNRGISVLAQLDGVVPLKVREAFPVNRDVYNLVPTSKLATAPWSTVFVGSGSSVCSNSAVIERQGFLPINNCGDTSINSTPVTP